MIVPVAVADHGQGTEKSKQGKGAGSGLHPGMNCGMTVKATTTDPDACANRPVPPVQETGKEWLALVGS